MRTPCLLLGIVILAQWVKDSDSQPPDCPSITVQEAYCRSDFAIVVYVIDETVTYWVPEHSIMGFGGFETREEMRAAIESNEKYQHFCEEFAKYRYNVKVVQWYKNATENWEWTHIPIVETWNHTDHGNNMIPRKLAPIVETWKNSDLHGVRLTPGKSYIIAGELVQIPLEIFIFEASECMIVLELGADDPRESEIFDVLFSKCDDA